MKYVKSKQNKERAERFRAALRAYFEHAGESPDEELKVDVGDLLIDAMHFCAQKKVNFDRALEAAMLHFEIEREGKE